MLVPHAVTGNWYIAKKGVDPTGLQAGSSPPRRRTESRLKRGSVYTLDSHWNKVQELVIDEDRFNKKHLYIDSTLLPAFP